MSLLAFRGVSKRFPDGARRLAVLDCVSFEIHHGERAGLHASRRAGKSTLLKIAAGLLAPDEGQVIWDDELDLASCEEGQRARARRAGGIALARGDWRVVRSVPVLEHVAMPLYNTRLTREESEQGARRALEWVGVPHLGYELTGQLGLRDRLIVDLARAVVRQPRLLLMDEPAVLAQPEEARAFYGLLHELSDRLGCALLIASDEPSALRGCKPMMSLSDGRLVSTSARHRVVDFPGAGRRVSREAS